MSAILTRWAVVALMFCAGAVVGLLGGLKYGQARLDAYQSSVAAAGQKQAAKTAAIAATQTAITARTNHETADLLRASDAYYRLRLDASPRSMPGLPDAAGGTDAAAAQPAPDPAGCSAADASADAIVILKWQQWAVAQGGAQDELSR